MWESFRAFKSVPFPIQVFMALLSVYVLYLANFSRSYLEETKKWPAVKGILFIGNALDFTREKVLSTLSRIPTEYGKIASFYLFQRHAYLVTDPDTIKEIFQRRPKIFRRRKNEDYVSRSMGFSHGLFSSNGTEWARIRRATAPSFSSLNVKYKFPAILEQMRGLIRRLKEQAESNRIVDMKFEAFSFTIRVITVVAFGVAVDDPVSAPFFAAEFLTDVVRMFRFVAEYRLFPLPGFLWKFSPQFKYEQAGVAAANRLTTAARAVIEKKRQWLADTGEKPSAMIDFMLVKEEAHAADALTDEEIVENVKTFFIAGAETTSVAITWVGFVLASFPDVVANIRKEVDKVLFHDIDRTITVDDMTLIPYTTAAVKEILRIYSPALASPFQIVVDNVVQLSNGLAVCPGEEVWINIEGAMRDPSVFSDPLSYKPERWLTSDTQILHKMENSFFAFGGGPRLCPGMHLAYTEIVLAMSFMSHYFDVELACPKEEIERVMIFAATANKMPLRFTLRKSFE